MNVWEYILEKMDYIKSRVWFYRSMFGYFSFISMEDVVSDLVLVIYNKLSRENTVIENGEVKFFGSIIRNSCIDLSRSREYRNLHDTELVEDIEKRCIYA